MAEAVTTMATKSTGANKGIGFEICKQLASHGIMVVLTARDEKRGIEAVEKLKGYGLSDHVVFHQLDLVDPASIASLAEFIKIQFVRLDILVNNAGVSGVIIDVDALRASEQAMGTQIKMSEAMTPTYELAEQCLQTNYYGAKRMIETFLPFLQSSNSPRIVNVSASVAKLKNISNEWAKGILSDVENLTEEKVDEVLTEFMKDFKEGAIQAKGWPAFVSAYTISKAAMNAHSRILAKQHPTFCINCVCPGFVKTDINYNTGILTVEEGAEGPVKLALLPDGGPSGHFFVGRGLSSFE